MGCTDCGRKGGCDSRKHVMFAAVDQALARLYPTRRWGERDEAAALYGDGDGGGGGGGGGISREQGADLAAAIAKRLNTLALFRAGDADEWCDYIYVLCLGRTPSIIEIREGQAAVAPESLNDDGGLGTLTEEPDEVFDERYLRVVLSGLACFAGVQEVAMTLRRQDGDVVITESARGGVFDPVLLPRFQSLVAVLAEREIRHLDFGEISEPPPGFDPAGYADRFGAEPAVANYLFYPQPTTTVSTVVLPARISSSA